MTVPLVLLTLAVLAMPARRSGSRAAVRRLAASRRRLVAAEPGQVAPAARWPGALVGLAAALCVLAVRSDAYGVVFAAISAVFLGASLGPWLATRQAHRGPADTSGCHWRWS